MDHNIYGSENIDAREKRVVKKSINSFSIMEQVRPSRSSLSEKEGRHKDAEVGSDLMNKKYCEELVFPAAEAGGRLLHVLPPLLMMEAGFDW